ncbi:MAG TPA: cation-translocating P-type ATPase [Anaerolineales bacterium]|nr:cation-translocating P-type ATPase [Anaerolineales bacterium]
MTEWHALGTEQAIQQVESNQENGLSAEEAARRLEKYGPNELVERVGKGPWAILAEQFKGIMMVMLMVSAAVSWFLGETIDAVVILIIVVLNGVLGFIQEYRAEQAMAALKKMAVPHVRVRRDGHLQELSATLLVPGDIVQLETGNTVPADGRLIESANLRVQEAVLTGESEAVEKDTAPLAGENLPLGDRVNTVYMGTVVTYGHGLALVTDTGMKTQLGKIADMLQSVIAEKTPLQRRLEQLARGLALAALVLVAIVFILGLLRGEDLVEMFTVSVAMAVAAVPEGLPAVVTIALALGAQRMLKRNALIRKLPAVETLGSVTVICSDKTGTLTQNQMTVTFVDVAENSLNLQARLRSFSPTVNANDEPEPLLQESPPIVLTLAGAALCNDAVLEPVSGEQGAYSTVGDPTEGALVIASAKAGLWKADLEKAFPRVAELPFDSDRKRMTTVHQPNPQLVPELLNPYQDSRPDFFEPGHYLVITKGAVDSLLEVSSQVWASGQTEPLDAKWAERIQKANNDLAQNGMRVLGLAFAQRDTPEPVEEDLIFIGMVGMIDPARPEVQGAVKEAREAGIRTVMITGDHPLTAAYIAADLGIAEKGKTLTGRDLDGMTIEQLEGVVENVPVYARVSPEHKLKLVQALQDRGHIVAMTGDGVNDAPALTKAEIGVAMGITGTDVTKEASDMILLDDNFATIVAAVREGRRIYDNIRKFIKYTMTSNAGEIWVMLLAPFIGMPLPLTSLQILWVNLVTDGLPGLALAIEPAERKVMQRPPYPPKENIFGRGMARDILWIGLLMGLVSLGVGYIYYRIDPAESAVWRTMIFTTLTLAQMGNALATRSDRDTLWQIGLLSNKAMLGSVLLTLALQMAVIYVPLLNRVFSTTPLSLQELLVSLAFGSVVFIAVEFFKWMRQRK